MLLLPGWAPGVRGEVLLKGLGGEGTYGEGQPGADAVLALSCLSRDLLVEFLDARRGRGLAGSREGSVDEGFEGGGEFG